MQPLRKEEYAAIIRDEAIRIGFSFCGFSKADFLAKEAPRLEQWLLENRHGKMAYMERYFDQRLDPRKLVDGAKSVVSLLYNYFPEKNFETAGQPRIAKYAYGEDYHIVVKEKLFELINTIRERIGEVNGRAFVDSAPVMEKAWAAKSGLGWVGKNGNLLTKTSGSFFFIAELIIDLELPEDGPIENYCGTCTKCIDACPTQAIIKPEVVDGSKCISYFTIELREEIPLAMEGQFGDWIFGCDVCQDVCPWNRFAKGHREKRFEPNKAVSEWREKEWEEITDDVFKKILKNSPLKRAGLEGIKRNLEFRRRTF